MGGIGTPTNGIDTNIQDQTTPPLDLYFTRSMGAPTTLTAPTEPIAPVLYEINVASAVAFAVNTYVGMFSGTGRFYFGTVLAVNANVLTMDTPLDFEFQVAGSAVLALSREMNVDGSVTPVTFQIQAGASGLLVDMTRIIASLIHSSAGDDGKFGNIAGGIARGLVLRKVDGVTRNYWNVKTNGDFRNLGYDVDYTSRSGGQGDYGTATRYTWAGQDKHGVVVRLGPNETLDAIVQDNLASLGAFHLLAGGHQTNERAVA